jgi:uncharacterized SAM-binding protein YcdF (DUF218 family)
LNISAFFSVSKLAWFLFAPSHLLLWLAILTAVLLLARRERGARSMAILTVGLFVVIGVLPVGIWLARPLEDQYPRQPLPAHVDGVITLGGGLDAALVVARQAPAAEASEARLVSTFELARLHPEARIVFSGGWGRFGDAVAARYVFGQLGLDPARLVLEDRSHDTFENLAFSRQLVNPQPGQAWVLATSAIQMPRAMAVARGLGWTLIPWPTDYITAPRGPLWDLGDEWNVPKRLAVTDAAAHEWLGLIAYQVSGRSGGRPPPPSSGK